MIIRVVDTETCGFAPDNQVVEVATVDLLRAEDDDEKHAWTRGRMWTSLVNPGRPIPPEASGIHHITDEMVKDAPSIAQVMDQVFADDGTGAPVAFAAHEAKFDRGSLGLEGANAGGLRWICTRKSAMTMWPEAPNHKNMTLRYWLGLKLADPSLATPHRALGDCYVTAAILRRLLSLHGTSVDDLVGLSAGPIILPRLAFGEHAMKPIDQVPLSYWQWIVEKSKGPWDEDVMHTARMFLGAGRAAQRNRSPV